MSDHPESTPETAPARGRRRPRQRMRTPQEARAWRRRIVGYAVLGFSFVLVVNALVGENGYLATMRANQQAAEVNDEIRRVRAETIRLEQEIKKLKSDPRALEDAARRNQHLSKPGETMVIIRDGTKKTDPPPAPAK